jgi:hypothetical protein
MIVGEKGKGTLSRIQEWILKTIRKKSYSHSKRGRQTTCQLRVIVFHALRLCDDNGLLTSIPLTGTITRLLYRVVSSATLP